MPKITVTPDDIKSLGTAEAGWYKAKLSEVKVEPSKGKDSMNYHFGWEFVDGTIVRKVPTIVNDKNRKYFVEGLVNIYEALFDVKIKEDENTELEPEKWVSLECYVQVEKGMYNNRPQNTITAYQPLSQPPF